MEQLYTGMSIMGFAVAGLFFLRYWSATRDRLFLIFALAFWTFGLQRLMIALTTRTIEDVAFLYLIRLLGFVLILGGIFDKNLRAKR